MAAAECLPETLNDAARSNRIQWLHQRREILEEKLALKNNELKALCIQEAEITGVLPPEIPLEPGESPPIIKKKINPSQNQNYNENLFKKLKTTRSSEESALELERQVQINIGDAALAVLNDPSESKANKRKHRSIYQQSQRRLQELNIQLNFIRQSHGNVSRNSLLLSNSHGSQLSQSTTKHRSKKPRPFIEDSGKDLSPKAETQSLIQEGCISLSPFTTETNSNIFPNYELQDLANHGFSQPGSSKSNRSSLYHASSPSDMRRGTLPSNIKYLENDFSPNNNIYIAPDNFRSRAYSQGGNSSSSSISPHLYPERLQRLVMPNTYTDEERQQQMMIRQLKLKKQQQQLQLQQKNEEEQALRSTIDYPDSRFSTIEDHRKSNCLENDIQMPQFEKLTLDYPLHCNHSKIAQASNLLRPRDCDDSTKSQELKGKTAVDTFVPPGYWMRLDDEIVWCSDDQCAIEKFNSLDRRKHNLLYSSPNFAGSSKFQMVGLGEKGSTTSSHSRFHPVQPSNTTFDTFKTSALSNSRILMRTQSLGSVENHLALANPHDGNINSSPQPKVKEWYDLPLESGPPPPPPPPPPGHRVRRGTQHTSMLPPPPTKERGLPVRSNSIPANRRLREPPQAPREDDKPRALLPRERFNEEREIPAESKPLPSSQENGNESTIPYQNQTMVLPGKYQPYREVTKPFEMSDFYKYSTKFRKRVEENSLNGQQQQTPPIVNIQQNEENQLNNLMLRGHQPAQRKTCPAHASR